MYGMFIYIRLVLIVNVGKYTIQYLDPSSYEIFKYTGSSTLHGSLVVPWLGPTWSNRLTGDISNIKGPNLPTR